MDNPFRYGEVVVGSSARGFGVADVFLRAAV
jgi:hypothetical protein